MNENSILEKIRTWCKSTHNTSTALGAGDDAAIVKPSGRPILFCSDMSIEAVHFDFAFSKPSEVAYKAIVRSLSDLAAMAAEPLGVAISIALPKSWTGARLETFLKEFYEGAVQCSIEFKAPIVGGDLTRAEGPVMVDVAAIGEAREGSSIWKRSGAHVGDIAFVTGKLGLAALALSEKKHFQPKPRFDVGYALAKFPITAAMDISDGLINDALRLCRESNVSLALKEKSWSEFELHGGDDYELLLAIDPAWSRTEIAQSLFRDLGIYEIGQFRTHSSNQAQVLQAGTAITPLGHDSFRDT